MAVVKSPETYTKINPKSAKEILADLRGMQSARSQPAPAPTPSMADDYGTLGSKMLKGAKRMATQGKIIADEEIPASRSQSGYHE